MSSNRNCITNIQRAWIAQYDSQAFTNSDVIIAAPAHLVSLLVSDKAASGTLYLQFFDAIAVPSNGAVPAIAPIILAAGTTVRLPLGNVSGRGYDGISFALGIAWAASTTAATLTVDASSSVWLTARYL